MAHMTDGIAKDILNGQGYTDHEVKQLAHHWLQTSQQQLDTNSSQSNGPAHSPLPWRITEANEKKSREIVDAKGITVAKLTALDMDNAELIVKGVNALKSTLPEIDLSDRCQRCYGGKDLRSNKCPAGKCDCEHYPKEKSIDEFKGTTHELCVSIKALLDVDAENALVPHGIGNHARILLAAAAERLVPFAVPYVDKLNSIRTCPKLGNACTCESGQCAAAPGQ